MAQLLCAASIFFRLGGMKLKRQEQRIQSNDREGESERDGGEGATYSVCAKQTSVKLKL